MPVPNLSRPGAPHLDAPDVPSLPSASAPSVSGPNVGVERPSVDAPGIREPAADVSLRWIGDFFSACFRAIWVLLTLPWWLVLAVVLVGRWLWLAWKRRAEEDAERRHSGEVPPSATRRAAP